MGGDGCITEFSFRSRFLKPIIDVVDWQCLLEEWRETTGNLLSMTSQNHPHALSGSRSGSSSLQLGSTVASMGGTRLETGVRLLRFASWTFLPRSTAYSRTGLSRYFLRRMRVEFSPQQLLHHLTAVQPSLSFLR